MAIDKRPVLMYAGGDPIYINKDYSYEFTGGMTINADGSPRCYGPETDNRALDFLENAGYPGNYWGIATYETGKNKGKPIIQGDGDPYPGLYVSTTSLKHLEFKNGDPRREINSEVVFGFVVPGPFIKRVKGIVMGCRGQVYDTLTKRLAAAVIFDSGPATHLGEGSMALAAYFGVNNNPKKGGTSAKRFVYTVFPGTPIDGFKLQASAS